MRTRIVTAGCLICLLYSIIYIYFLKHYTTVNVQVGWNQHKRLQNNKDGNVISNNNTQMWKKINTTRMCTSRERYEHIGHVCKTKVSKEELYNTSYIKQPNKHLIVDDKHQVIFCVVQKSSSSTWLRLLVNASNPGMYAKTIQREKQQGGEHNPLFHSVSYLNRAGLKSLNTWIPEYTNYTKFLVVRHPLDRLLSAYYDKICRDYLSPWLKKLKEILLSKYPADSSENNCMVSLSDFIHFITSSQQGYHINEHWASYSNNFCYPCHIKYDHILRLETLTLDREPILNELGLHIDPGARYHQNTKRYLQASVNAGNNQKGPKEASVDSEKSNQNNNYEDSFGEKELFDYHGINGSYIQALLNYYKDDMDLFGYYFDVYNYRAGCSIRTSTGQHCC